MGNHHSPPPPPPPPKQVLNTLKNVGNTIVHTAENVGDTIKSSFEHLDFPTIGDIKNSFTKPIDELRNNITGTLHNVENNITRPINDLENKITGTFNGIEKQIGSTFNNLENKMENSFEGIGHKIEGKFTDIGNDLKNDFNKVKTGVLDATSKVEKIAEQIPEETKKIVSLVGDKMKEEFSKMESFFNTLGKKIVEAFLMIGEKLEMVLGQIVKIGKLIENFGEYFYNKFLKPIMYDIFGMMKEVFEFIWTYIIPFLKNIVLFLVKYVPIIALDIYQGSKKFAINLYETLFISSLIAPTIFISLNMFFFLYLENPYPILLPLVYIITALTMFNLIMYNKDFLKDKQHKLISYIIFINKSHVFQKIFGKVPTDFGKDIGKSLEFLYKRSKENPISSLVSTMIFLLVIKIIFKLSYRTVFRFPSSIISSSMPQKLYDNVDILSQILLQLKMITQKHSMVKNTQQLKPPKITKHK
jgi:hypothetical protein